MTIPFDAFFRRVADSTDIASQMDMARALGVNRSAITQAKTRNAVPQKWVLALSRRYNISPDWLEFGIGAPAAGNAGARPSIRNSVLALPETGLGTIMVPKVRAVLCAGGGSLELEAVPVSEHPFPHAWLSRMGSPNAMVFMDVIGDSMEPGIRDGDMVLVDQANRESGPKAVMAVGYEDAIFIKRLEKRSGGLVMVSDNPDYAPVSITGDELESFRIIGKVVWLCRDCRYA